MKIGMILGTALLAAGIGFAAEAAPEPSQVKLERQVQRELVTLPFYNLFDYFQIRVDGGTVTLRGKVTRPTLKTDAEAAVKEIPGIKFVKNEIEVLPLSPNDDRLRMAVYRAIYGHTVLQTLAIHAVPPIHILVENGNVTLEGAVADSMQKAVAGSQANSVRGVFSVVNNLLIDNES